MNESSSLTLPCTGSGIPVPTLTWLRNEMQLVGPQVGSSVFGTTVGSQSLAYNITNARAINTGWYTCRGARTFKGKEYTMESKVYVNVQGKRGQFFLSFLCIDCLVNRTLYRFFIGVGWGGGGDIHCITAFNDKLVGSSRYSLYPLTSFSGSFLPSAVLHALFCVWVCFFFLVLHPHVKKIFVDGTSIAILLKKPQIYVTTHIPKP